MSSMWSVLNDNGNLKFYNCDLGYIDMSSDWRTKAIKGVRQQLSFVGYYFGSFPVKEDIVNELKHR